MATDQVFVLKSNTHKYNDSVYRGRQEKWTVQDRRTHIIHHSTLHQSASSVPLGTAWPPLVAITNNVPSCLTFLSQWTPSSLLSFPTCLPLSRPRSERRFSHGSFWSAVGWGRSGPCFPCCQCLLLQATSSPAASHTERSGCVSAAAPDEGLTHH